MKQLTFASRTYILITISIGLGLIPWMATTVHWANMGLYLLAVAGAVAQTLKVEGPNEKTNYNTAWFVYGFAFLALGPAAALFVVVISHLVEWIWHRYPWYIQSFNIGAHVIPLYLAAVAYERVLRGAGMTDLSLAVSLAAANLIFVFGNHFLVGMVVRLARGQSLAQSGVFGFFTLFLDFTLLSMGTGTAIIWSGHPIASLLNILPLYLLYSALRVPSLKRQIEELKKNATRSQIDEVIL